MSGLPRLVLLNGVPGAGKSMLAAAWVADRPLALALDVDVVRALVGGWTATPHDAGLAARRLALAMAASHLGEGLDVVVPQYVAVDRFVDALQGLASGRAEFHHVVLSVDREVALQRLASRPDDGVRTPLDADGFDDLAQRLAAFVAGRPEARALPAEGNLAAVHAALDHLLADRGQAQPSM